MSDVLRILLILNLSLFVLSLALFLSPARRGVGRTFFALGILGQFAFLTVAFSNKVTFAYSWVFRSQVIIFYLFVFNLLIFRFSRKRNISFWFPAVMNVFFIIVSTFLFEPRFLIGQFPALNSYLLKLTLVFGSLTFTLISFQIYLLLFEKQSFLNLRKVISAFALLFWILSIASNALWTNYAWGRFWSWDTHEIQSLVVMAFLFISLAFKFTPPKKALLLISLLIIMLLIAFPIFEFFNLSHGGYA